MHGRYRRGDVHATSRHAGRRRSGQREQGARWWELRATSSLARLATGGSVADDLAQLVAWFEGTESPDLRDARQVLAELRGHRA